MHFQWSIVNKTQVYEIWIFIQISFKIPTFWGLGLCQRWSVMVSEGFLPSEGNHLPTTSHCSIDLCVFHFCKIHLSQLRVRCSGWHWAILTSLLPTRAVYIWHLTVWWLMSDSCCHDEIMYKVMWDWLQNNELSCFLSVWIWACGNALHSAFILSLQTCNVIYKPCLRPNFKSFFVWKNICQKEERK